VFFSEARVCSLLSMKICASYERVHLSLSLSLFLSHRCGAEHRLVNNEFSVCRLDSGYPTRRVDTRVGFLRESRRKFSNPKARRFRAST
jgi:hypothetical protein